MVEASHTRVRLEVNGKVVERDVRGWSDMTHILGLNPDTVVGWRVDSESFGESSPVMLSDEDDWEGFGSGCKHNGVVPLMRPVTAAKPWQHFPGTSPSSSSGVIHNHADPLSIADDDFDSMSSSVADDAGQSRSASSLRNCTDSVDSASTSSPRPAEVLHIDHSLADRLHELQQSMKMSLDQVLALLLKRYDSPSPARPTLIGIPTHILVIMFLFLPSSEMRRLGRICSQWRGIVTTNYLVKQYVCHQGLYVIGGINRKSVTLRTVVKCKPSSPEWSDARPMLQDRYHCGTAIYNRRVYVFGGRNNETRLASCEVYDPLTNAWGPLPSMRAVRSAPACAVHSGAIYVFGGFDGQQEYKTVERLDPTTNTWADTSGIAPMPLEVCSKCYPPQKIKTHISGMRTRNAISWKVHLRYWGHSTATPSWPEGA